MDVGGVRARATARVTLECNNACIFCGQAGVEGNRPPHDQLSEARSCADEVTFVGGEPTLDPRLRDHVALARSMGFVRVGLQTNGRRLGEPGYAASLATAGLTDVHVSIHGSESAVHDYHTGSQGSLAETLGGLAAARASGLEAAVTTVLTRSNFRALGGLPRLLSSRGVAGWLVSVPRAAGRLSAGFDRIMPRLGLALPFALSALEAGEVLGIDVWIAGAPRCLLGPLARWALFDGARAFAVECEGCPARQGCTGLDGAYLERFGGDELSPARLRSTPRDAGRDTRIARMFVGPGELAITAAPPSPVPKPKVALPIAGKVRPAVAEAGRTVPKRTGDALREILPGLFERTGPTKG
jgi:hypothetical protein